jgi:hypothetical protein
MNRTAPSITFFYPAHQVGGAELLFTRLASYVVEHYGIDARIVDYRDGFLRNQVVGTGVRVVDYDEGAPTRIDDPTCLVAPFSLLFQVKRELELHPESTVLFWVLHPYNFLMVFPFFSSYQQLRMELIQLINATVFFEDRRKIQEAIDHLNRHRGLYFMDSACARFSSQFFTLDTEAIRYLPITNLDKTREAGATVVARDAEHIGWLGRLSREKVYPLLNVIENADAYAERRRRTVVVHVIGEGECMPMVRSYPRRAETLEIVYAGTKLGDALDAYLIDNVDVLFAMGTSCFEGAQLKLPTVLVGASFQRIRRDYRYRWLFETEGYSLGGYANKEDNPHSFDEIMSEVFDRGNKGAVGKRNHEYFVQNHSMAKVSEMLLRAATDDTATMRGLASETSIFEQSAILRAYLAAVRMKNKIKSMMQRPR